MARKPRIEFPGAVYHLIGRGNYRKALFEQRGAAEAFEKAIGETSVRCGWNVHAYVLMRNHYHLVAETPTGNLVEGMRWLQGVFGNRFNRFHGERGHVFQGRYKALLVEPDLSLTRVVDYVHLNPVRAGLVEFGHLLTYGYSSLPSHLLRTRPPWLRRDLFLELLNLPDSLKGMRRYLDHLSIYESADTEQIRAMSKEFCRGWVIGSNGYRKALAEEFSQMELAKDWGGPELRELNQFKWEKMVSDELKQRSKTEADLARAPKSADWKREIALRLRTETSAGNPWIAERLLTGHPSLISRWVREESKIKG